MLVAAKKSEPSKAGTTAPSVLNPQSASRLHTTLLDYLQAFQRNEDPGQDLIRASLSDPLNGDTFTNVVQTPSVIPTNEPQPILFGPMDIGYDWSQVNLPSFPFDLANVSAPLQTDPATAAAAAAAASQVHVGGDTFLGQGQEAHLAPPGLSHGAVFGAAEEDSSIFRQFFANQMAALDNNGPDQSWESLLSSYPG